MSQIATITANADTPPRAGMSGQYALSMEGDFSGGTLQFVFLDEAGNELTPSTDWAFTASPEFPQAFGFPVSMKFILRMTGAGTPNVVVKAFKYFD